MGLIRFNFESPLLATNRVLSSIHMVGFDGSIWPCKAELVAFQNQSTDLEDENSRAPDQIVIQRNVAQSGRLFLLFPFRDLGEIVVGTGTIVERETPFVLDVELARGTLNRLRNQLSNWQEGGLEIPQPLNDRVEEAQVVLSTAIYGREESGTAVECLEQSVRTILDLSVEFGKQVSDFRKNNEPKRKILFGIESSNGADEPLDRFSQVNTVVVPAGLSCLYRQDEAETVADNIWVRKDFCEGKDDQFAIAGPLISARPDGFPKWIQELDHIEKRRQAILEVVRQSCDQLQDQKCDLIHAVSGINGIGHRYLTFSQQLHMTIDIVQMIESSNLNMPIIVSFDQPWGERIAWSVGGGQSLQIADTLLRHGCRIDALGLEINLDYWPNGSLIREPTQWTELLDFWSHFGLPLFVFLRMPVAETEILVETEKRLPRQQGILGEMNVKQRAYFLQSVLPLLLSRPNIQGIIWSHSDEFGAFSHCGVESPQDAKGPIVKVISEALNQWEV